MQQIPAIKDAIDGLYFEFEKYPSNLNMIGSPMYGDKLNSWNSTLCSIPLRELSGEDLSRYSFKALTTWGEINDFKHFLPRIFELLVSFDYDVEEWLVMDKLNYGKWETWPKSEISVLNNYFLSFWKKIVNDNSSKVDAFIGDYFAAISNVYKDFNLLLQIWRDIDSENSIRNLTNYIFEESVSILSKKELPGFYTSTERGEQLYEWLTSKELLDYLESRFFKYQQSEFSNNLSSIIGLIENERKTI